MVTTERALIVIAVAALLAIKTQVPGSEPQFGHSSDVRVNSSRMDAFWPFTLDLCAVPVCMEIGHVVEINIQARDVEGRVIVLRQVACKDIRRDDEKDWPCYSGCEKLSIRATIDIKLDTRLDKTSSVIDQWEASLDTDIVTGSGEWQTVEVCVTAWRAKLHEATGPQQAQVGTLTITVKPAV
ncbi:MAG: hypothetical protein ACYSWQ_02935 [Planctomycetota bacterium]|jgi:hypothetical protein